MSQNNLQEEAQVYIEQGDSFREQGNIEQAIQAYQQAIKPAIKLAEIYESQEYWTEAAKYYQRVLGLRPNLANNYLRMAKVLLNQNKIYGAIAAYQTAIELKPDLPAKVYQELGDLLFEQRNDLDLAVQAYQKVLTIDANCSANFFKKLGDALSQQKRFNEAINYYQSAIEIDPNYHQAYLALGNAQVKKNYFNEGIENYKKSVKIKPDFAPGYQRIADVFKQKGQLDIALQCYKKVLELNPDATNVYRFLGDIFMQQGKIKAAQKCYARASQASE